MDTIGRHTVIIDTKISKEYVEVEVSSEKQVTVVKPLEEASFTGIK